MREICLGHQIKIFMYVTHPNLCVNTYYRKISVPYVATIPHKKMFDICVCVCFNSPGINRLAGPSVLA